MGVSVSVVIPAFNEQRRIGQTVRTIDGYLRPRHKSHEIIIADDGSHDETPRVAAAMAQEGLPIRVLIGNRNRGKGDAVRRGVLASSGEMVLVTDADLATPIEEMGILVEQVSAGADIAVGSRGLASSQLLIRQPLPRELLGRAFNLLVQATVLPGIWDTQCGFKLFKGGVARGLFSRVVADGFAFDVEVLGLAARTGFRISEVPVRWSHVANSKVRVGRDALGMLLDLLGIIYRVRRAPVTAFTGSPAVGEAGQVPTPEET